MSNNPKHQHFIPKSYLRKFGYRQPPKHKKCFLDFMDLTSKEVKSHVSVNDICVKPNHYTLPIEGEGKYKLEAYYAQHVDDVYPEVYELLINTSISKISNNQKHKILNTLLSLYFRTPKVLKSANKLIDDTIDKAVALTHEGQNVIKLNMDGRKLTFTKDQIDEIKKTEHEINHRGFLLSHLELWHEFVAYKYNCGILVYELEGDVELITSDFPVIINGPSNQRFHLFNPDNMIQIPIDRKHYVMIAPNSEKVMHNHVFRSIGDDLFALSTNYQIQKNADRQIFGYPGTIEKHINDQLLYGTETPDNLKRLEDVKSRVAYLKELYAVMETAGPFSKETLLKIEALLKMDIFKGDKELLNLKSELGFK